MADERYQWLDQEAAERLLRGEPVDPVDDRARRGAERLAKALDTARTPDLPPAVRTELPGEAAALAAFRQTAAARSAAARTGAATAATARVNRAGRADHADLGHVRLSTVTAPARRWGRSVRYGLAAAVAAVTVGGVAVAAGTGMLPLVGPAPSTSVTAGESADPLVSADPGIREDPEAPPTRPGDGDGSPGASPSAGTGTGTTAPPTGGPDGRGGEGTPKPGRSGTAGTEKDSGGTGKDSGGTGKDTGGTGTDAGTTLAREKAVRACRAYRSGKLDATGRTQLTGALRDGETLRRYCDRILGGAATGTPGETGQDGSKDGSEDDSQDDPKGDKETGGSGAGNDRKGSGGNGTSGNGSGGRSAGTASGLTATIPLDLAVTAPAAPRV
ncbi:MULTISPECIES: hypothetical protein [unclassified Streptomyces]|uniref:hypothetical protein n=1 Tax=unclassified Streptomyces TaxID=2593676 RepID=UPI0006F6DCB7|nr:MULTISPECIES: hypothetical protein [unclassified Streptomyces]KQX59028.1 hypothetical protein ASD33_01620 [Streptomyces sp. Root1304]KRB00290.1 hypothetical protein ASE09_01620 [Streptomyces sp. Root66D1]